jgi:hypothetical protein
MYKAVALVLAVFFVGCGSKDKDATGNSVTKRFTLDETNLSTIIHLGMSREALITKLGEPLGTTDVEGGYIAYDYLFEVSDWEGPRRSVVAGVSVFLKNDKVAEWKPIHQMVGGYRKGDTPVQIEPRRSAEGQVPSDSHLTFWLLSDQPTEGGRYIDTERLPKLGFIPKEPSLRIVRLKGLLQRREITSNAKNEEVENPVLGIELVAEDAPSFEKLTRETQGKRVLMMVGETPVIAPMMSVVITGGKLQLPWGNAQDFNDVRDKLAELLPQK